MVPFYTLFKPPGGFICQRAERGVNKVLSNFYFFLCMGGEFLMNIIDVDDGLRGLRFGRLNHLDIDMLDSSVGHWIESTKC